MRKLILIIIIFAGCSKKEDKPSTAITVLEKVTNLPISAADVFVNTGDPANLLSGRNLFTSVTDDNGICQVPSELYDDATWMYVGEKKHWPFQDQKNTTIYLTPEGWLQLHFHQVGNYPVDSDLLLTMVGESGWPDPTLYGTARFADTLYTVRAFGSQQNKIDWQVRDAGHNIIANGTLTGLQIPRFDTLKNVTLDY
jgi:hypothetical protein